jgi:hypothetical protein
VDEAGNNTRETQVWMKINTQGLKKKKKKKKERKIIGTFPNCYQFPGFSPPVLVPPCAVLCLMPCDAM